MQLPSRFGRGLNETPPSLSPTDAANYIDQLIQAGLAAWTDGDISMEQTVPLYKLAHAVHFLDDYAALIAAAKKKVEAAHG